MRTVINHKVYDTATAKLVGACDCSGDSPSAAHVEALFRKRTGEHFLFARTAAGYENISPCSYDDACSWASAHLCGRAFEDAFSKAEGGTYRIDCTVSAACKAEIDRRRAVSGRTVAQVVEDAFSPSPSPSRG